MPHQWRYFFFLIWFAYLIVTSILLFAEGFLLSRVVQQRNSTCLSFDALSCGYPKFLDNDMPNWNNEICSNSDKTEGILNNLGNASNFCLPPRAKVIFIIIDALRYDFATYNESLTKPLPFQNKLTVIHDMIKRFPKNSRLYKFVADPPTTTMQRLKGLTTGTLPTFIDAGNNFDTYEITEDNLIDQMVKNDQTMVFTGDNTWIGLYPNRFTRQNSYPSFNVRDLDSVDQGVLSNLYPEINNSKDWKLLIGHFLGVDHCGHIYGPHHKEMTRKLLEMNIMIQKVIQEMDSDTVLYVIGDHGMTTSGNHGGETDNEIESALFVYSKKPLLNYTEQSNVLKQVNLVPTLATVLGVPIPFSNLGSVVLNALPAIDDNIPEWRYSTFALWSNVQQLFEYIDEYSRTSTIFDTNDLHVFRARYAVLNARMRGVKNDATFEEFAKSCLDLMDRLRGMCERIWVQYDAAFMTRGLLFLFSTIFFVFLIVDGVPRVEIVNLFNSTFFSVSYLIVLTVAVLIYVAYFFRIVVRFLPSLYFGTGLASQLLLALLVVQNWKKISNNWASRSRGSRTLNLIFKSVLGFNLLGMFSNSYVMEESYVLLFLLGSVTLVGIVVVIKVSREGRSRLKASKWGKYRYLVFVFVVSFLLRLSVMFWVCREDQDWCVLRPHGLTLPVEASKYFWIATVIGLALFVTATGYWLRSNENFDGYSFNIYYALFAPPAIVVFTAGFWVFQRLPYVKLGQADFMAWFVYFFIFVGITVTFIDPLFTLALPHIRRHQVSSKFEKIPIVNGLPTTYSATYVVIGLYVSLMFALLLGDIEGASVGIMFMTAMFVLTVTSIIRIKGASSLENIVDVPNTTILIWVIVSHYFFYGTGHQASFTNIDWKAGFTGTTGNLTHIIPGSLIIMHTFCSYILIGFMCPLLTLAPFTYFVMLPQLIANEGDVEYLTSRGELLLYDKQKVFYTSAFITGCKYVACHGIRVFASTLAATIHCRHLFVWKVFAPKFIFEGVGMFVTLVSVMLGYLLLFRINKKVFDFIEMVNHRLN